MTYAERKRHREAKAAIARAERALDWKPKPKPEPIEHAPIRTGLPRHLLVFMSEEDAQAAEAIRDNGGFKPTD